MSLSCFLTIALDKRYMCWPKQRVAAFGTPPNRPEVSDNKGAGNDGARLQEQASRVKEYSK